MAPIPKTEPAAAPFFDEAAIRSHVEMLHSLAHGLVGKFVVSAFFANPTGEDKAGGVISHHPVGDVDGMVDAVLAHAETPNANCYVCPNLMRPTLERGKKGAEADVVAVLSLVADLDDDTGRSGGMPVDPNYVIESSPGNFQCFLMLDKPLPVAEAKQLAGALKRAANADHCTVDVSHVWRVPGGLNWPNAKKLARGRSPSPSAVTVAQSWDGALTSVDELRIALEPWASAPMNTSSAALGELPALDGLEISAHAAELLAADDVGDRSAWASKVVEQLAFDGLTAEQACTAFLSASGDWFSRYETKDPVVDFKRMWPKFGLPHTEARAADADVTAAFVASNRAKRTLVAANDNVPADHSSTPPMHPDPFTPEAAGGLLESIATWVTDTAIVPVPELSLAASIALLGGSFGNLAIGPTNAGVNVYFTTLLATAGGKGHPPKAIRALGDLCGAQGAVSNGDPTSYAALERMLRRSISTVVTLDEFGITLQDINGRNQNSASASIRKMLLAVYDQSNSVFDGRIYASSETKKDDGPLVGPALTVLAMTTPSTLYAGLSAASVSDGFINRFVFVTGTRDESSIRPPRLNVKLEPPAPLVAALQNAITNFPNGTSGGKYKIPFDGGEQGEAYKRWGEVFMWQHRSSWDEVYGDICGRAAENTIRLATIRAISRDARSPVINLTDVEWAWAVVFRSIDLIAKGVTRHMSSSPAEALRKCIIEVLREAPEHTIAYSQLLRRKGVRGSDLREVDGALTYLMESGEIRILGKPKPGSGSKFQLLDLATEVAT